MIERKKLLFIVNVDWFFTSHRLPIAIEAIKQGYEVHIATSVTNKLDFLVDSGLIVHPINLHRSNTNVKTIYFEFMEVLLIIRKISPDIIHLVTIKPVLMGGIAARVLSISSVVSAISGLGFIFMKRGIIAQFRRKAALFLYHLALGHPNQKVIFQNRDDQSLLSKLTILSSNRTVLIRGSGVDLTHYNMQPLSKSRVPRVLFAARLLEDKGVREFVHAAELVNSLKIRANFVLAGDIDLLNPASIQQSELDNWKEGGLVEFLGYREDMERVLSSAVIVVLPSYREGFPKVLIEAAACGRAVITTDVPGCRDAIENGVTGLLIPARSAKAIANAVLVLLDDAQRCEEMGRAGRKRAENMFDVDQVVAEHIKVYKELLCH
jgi:glycosyltransferase involved in cell wall biosynthesis